MAENSKIEWTDNTFNPWMGCTKVSPGCAHCYAEAMMDKRMGVVHWGKGNPRKLTSRANWNKVLAWQKDAKRRAPDIRPRVFVASLADWLDDEVPVEWLAWLLDHVQQCPNLDFLMLTKRPELWRKRISHAMEYWRDVSEMNDEVHDTHRMLAMWLAGHAPKNIWVGTSVEDQERAETRMPEIVEIPAIVKFLSVEPLLGPLDLSYWLTASIVPQVQWVIVGGESGPSARPIEEAWVKDLRDECHFAGVDFFFKQWGGRDKKAAGRLLDGRTWDAVPSQNAPALGAPATGSSTTETDHEY